MLSCEEHVGCTQHIEDCDVSVMLYELNVTVS